MTDKSPAKPDLWTPRSVADTIAVYRDWAAHYDADLTARGYHTPRRIAESLRDHLPPDALILDFGCGTGLSGLALRAAGFTAIHGTDVTQEMLDRAQDRAVYDKIWRGSPGTTPAQPGTYRAIIAAGVISLGAAPAETLTHVIDALAPDALFAFSFNDPTLAEGSYDRTLTAAIDAGRVALVSRTHGPHLDDLNMGSDIIILRRL